MGDVAAGHGESALDLPGALIAAATALAALVSRIAHGAAPDRAG